MSCEAQAMTPMPRRCLKWPCCTNTKARLVEQKGFLVCPLCHASYGRKGFPLLAILFLVPLLLLGLLLLGVPWVGAEESIRWRSAWGLHLDLYCRGDCDAFPLAVHIYPQQIAQFRHTHAEVSEQYEDVHVSSDDSTGALTWEQFMCCLDTYGSTNHLERAQLVITIDNRPPTGISRRALIGCVKEVPSCTPLG